MSVWSWNYVRFVRVSDGAELASWSTRADSSTTNPPRRGEAVIIEAAGTYRVSDVIHKIDGYGQRTDIEVRLIKVDGE